MITYEERLNADLNWAFQQGDLYFAKRSFAHQSLRRLATTFDELDVEYAVTGAMAMFYHGYRRFTASVDVVISVHDPRQLEPELKNHDFVRREPQNHFRDERNGVRILLLPSGRSTAKDRATPIVVPNPNESFVEIDGIRFLSLPKLIELKLASGQASFRLKDLADVQSIIQELKLAPDLADRFQTTLRDSYRQCWDYAQIAALDDY